MVEVVIASAIGAVVMAGLASVILTSVQATGTATSRVEASSELRTIEFFARDDFARSSVPTTCPGVPATSCLVLRGQQVTGSSAPQAQPYQVMYTWDGSAFLDRQVGTEPARHIASDVTAFTWYVQGSGQKQTCVLQVTVTVGGYSESQTLLFYPQLQ